MSVSDPDPVPSSRRQDMRKLPIHFPSHRRALPPPRRFLSVWLPFWPTDRRLRLGEGPPPETPFVVSSRDGQRRVVVAVDALAQGLGLRPGMPVARAQAMVPRLHLAEADVSADAAALERLAVWALRYTPIAAVDPPDGLVLDVAGAAHLAHGEKALLDGILGRFRHAGLTAQAAMAETWSAAWGLARLRPGTIVPSGALAEAVEDLPLEALRIEPDLVGSLRGLGFETIADLSGMPSSALELRFGRQLLQRLDAVRGRVHETVEPVLGPSIPHVRLAFADPLGHLNGLTWAVRRLAALLCAELDGRGLGTGRIDLRLHRVDGHLAVLRVGTGRPTRDPAHIARLFRDRLEGVDPGFGIEAAVLAATRVGPLEARQLAVGQGGEEADLAHLVDRIAGRIGTRRVYRLARAETVIPERGIALVQPLAAPAGRGWDDGPRPQRLLDPPAPVEVVALMPDHPPAAYTWGHVRRRVRSADGPESVAGEWWSDPTEVFLVRDYFRVEDETGLRLWMFRATGPETTRWFVQGIFA